jgi:hypothetical protein
MKMKTTKHLLVALMITTMAASSAFAQRTTRTARVTARPSIASSRAVAPRTYTQSSVASSGTQSNWNHQRHYRSRSNVYFNFGYGYPYYGYPYYGYGGDYPYYDTYPYDYGYYTPSTNRYPVYNRGITDDATVAAVQRRLAHGGYYHGSIDGVIGPGTRTAIRAFERNNGLPVDGVIDGELLRTMGLT